MLRRSNYSERVGRVEPVALSGRGQAPVWRLMRVQQRLQVGSPFVCASPGIVRPASGRRKSA